MAVELSNDIEYNRVQTVRGQVVAPNRADLNNLIRELVDERIRLITAQNEAEEESALRARYSSLTHPVVFVSFCLVTAGLVFIAVKVKL